MEELTYTKLKDIKGVMNQIRKDNAWLTDFIDKDCKEEIVSARKNVEIQVSNLKSISNASLHKFESFMVKKGIKDPYVDCALNTVLSEIKKVNLPQVSP